MKPLHGDAKVRTCADADEELDRLSRDLAAERARAEKAEAALGMAGQLADDAQSLALGYQHALVTTRKRAEMLAVALRALVETVREYAAVLRHARVTAANPAGLKDAAAEVAIRLAEADAALASPSESAPPKDQGAGGCAPAAPLGVCGEDR